MTQKDSIKKMKPLTKKRVEGIAKNSIQLPLFFGQRRDDGEVDKDVVGAFYVESVGDVHPTLGFPTSLRCFTENADGRVEINYAAVKSDGSLEMDKVKRKPSGTNSEPPKKKRRKS